MRHPVVLTVLAALSAGVITAPLLPAPQPQGVVVEDVRAANNLVALKTGCYLVTLDSTPRASSAIGALQQGDDAVRQGYATALRFINRSGGPVRGVEIRRDGAHVFLTDRTVRMETGAGMALAVAADAPITLQEELLKSAGQNICAGETDEWTR